METGHKVISVVRLVTKKMNDGTLRTELFCLFSDVCMF